MEMTIGRDFNVHLAANLFSKLSQFNHAYLAVDWCSLYPVIALMLNASWEIMLVQE